MHACCQQSKGREDQDISEEDLENNLDIQDTKFTNKRGKSLTPSEAVVEDHWGRRSENVGGHLRKISPFSLFQTMSVLIWCPTMALSPEAQFTFSNPFTITNVLN